MADGRVDLLDVVALEPSVNDSAGRVSSIWLSFVAFSAYLAAAASMISHQQMFLEEPIKLPTINIDLPLVASAIVLPLLFVIYHVFVLLQVVLLSRTADTYNDAIEATAKFIAQTLEKLPAGIEPARKETLRTDLEKRLTPGADPIASREGRENMAELRGKPREIHRRCGP